MKRIFSDRLILIESLVIVIPLIIYYFIKIQSNTYSSELLINCIFILLFMSLLLFRNNSFRHMYFAFIFLLLSVLGNLLMFNELTYITGGLTLSLFLLGVINMILFQK